MGRRFSAAHFAFASGPDLRYAQRAVLAKPLIAMLVLLAASRLVSGAEAAGAFRLVDEEGVTHITDTPASQGLRLPV